MKLQPQGSYKHRLFYAGFCCIRNKMGPLIRYYKNRFATNLPNAMSTIRIHSGSKNVCMPNASINRVMTSGNQRKYL